MKKTVPDLALFGGVPAFSQSLHVNRPNLGSREVFLQCIGEMLDRRWFTNDGPLAVELETALAEYLGVKHCVLTCNGTMALQLVCRGLDLQGEIIVPAFTFIATAHAPSWQGLKPVYCDIDRETSNIDPEACEALITERTSAIIGVHLWGRPCDTERLEAIARRHSLHLLFDAAHAFACGHRGRKIGGFGDAEIFSFHATKLFHTMEGGAVTTNNDALAERIRRLRNFGFNPQGVMEGLGVNGKMSEASAAMGLANLGMIDRLLREAKTNYQIYQDGLSGIPGLNLIIYDDAEGHNHHYVVVDIDEDRVGLSRDQLLAILRAENILARDYFYPGCHRMAPYDSAVQGDASRLPVTDELASRVLVLPAGGAMSREQIKPICAIFRLAIAQSHTVRSMLSSNSGVVMDGCSSVI